MKGLSEMMSGSGGGEGASGEGGAEGINSLLETLLGNISKKSVLHQSMKNLEKSLKAWLEKNGESVEPAELERYNK